MSKIITFAHYTKKINAFTLYRKSIDKPNCYKTSLKQWRYSRRAIVTLEINMFF
jgi:hypothetical protein